MWPGSSGIAYISGKYVNSNWMINGTVAIFTYWNESFPQDQSVRDCLAQNLDPPYRWMNIPCSQPLPYICEVSMVDKCIFKLPMIQNHTYKQCYCKSKTYMEKILQHYAYERLSNFNINY